MSPTTGRNEAHFPLSQFPLPVEILEEILKWVPPILQTNDNDMWEGYAPLLVCKNWRAVVDGAGSLWATISMDFCQWCKAATPALLKLWIRKSGQARGLHIDIRLLTFTPRPVDPLSLSISRSNLESVISNLNRLESLRIICLSHLEVEKVLYALNLAKRLKHLDLIIPNTHEPPILQELGAPYRRFATLRTELDGTDLRTVAVRGWLGSYYPATLPALCGTKVTELTLVNLRWIAPSAFAALCQQLPNIQSLTIKHVSFKSSTWQSNGRAPDPDTWGSTLKDKMVLRRLRCLHVRGVAIHPIPRAIYHCGPELTTLSVEITPNWWCVLRLCDALETCPVTLCSMVVRCKPQQFCHYPYSIDDPFIQHEPPSRIYFAHDRHGLTRALCRLKLLSSFRIEPSSCIGDALRAGSSAMTQEDLNSLIQIAQSRNDPQMRIMHSLPYLDVSVHKDFIL